MPNYLFESLGGETQDVYFKIADAPKVGETIDIDGAPWRRIFTVPQARIAITIDPYNKADFVKKLEGKNDTLGELWDRSSELSAKRAEKDGVDKVKEKHFDQYAKKSKGMEHPLRQKDRARKTAEAANQSKALREMGVTIKVNP